MKKDILIGQRFGHLTVVRLNNKDNRGASWVCKCDCGKEIILPTCYLIGSKSRSPNKSCGCSQKKQAGKSLKYPRVYRVWKSMIYRCYNPRQTNYERYGGKGVTVCEEWLNSFDAFLNWALNNGYSDELTIDRIDSTKPYQSDNCRWETYFTQEANRGLTGNNTSGHTGVSRLKNGSYRAYLQRKGKKVHIGCFKTKGEAIAARKNLLEHYERTGTI